MRSRLRFLLVFFVLLIILETLLLVPWIDAHIVTPFSVGVSAVSAALLRLIGEGVTTAGTIISGACLAIDIHNGCNGVEVMLFVVAAMVAFPATWKQRGLAVLLSCVLLQLANLIRVVTLYWIGCHHRAVFDMFHAAVWQTLMFALAVGIFMLWTRRVKPAHAA